MSNVVSQSLSSCISELLNHRSVCSEIIQANQTPKSTLFPFTLKSFIDKSEINQADFSATTFTLFLQAKIHAQELLSSFLSFQGPKSSPRTNTRLLDLNNYFFDHLQKLQNSLSPQERTIPTLYVETKTLLEELNRTFARGDKQKVSTQFREIKELAQELAALCDDLGSTEMRGQMNQMLQEMQEVIGHPSGSLPRLQSILKEYFRILTSIKKLVIIPVRRHVRSKSETPVDSKEKFDETKKRSVSGSVSANVIGNSSAPPNLGYLKTIVENSEKEINSSFQMKKVIGTTFSGGEVWKAKEFSTGLRVAMKVVPLSHRNVIKKIIRWEHKNLLRHLNLVDSKSGLWVIMELCPLGSIQQILSTRTTGLPEPIMAQIIKQVLDGLTFLHSIPIAHQNITTGNLLVSSDLIIKISDSGSSEVDIGKNLLRRYYWVAPETITSSITEPIIDLWSLGICIIEMAEGTPPYQNFDVKSELSKQIVKSPPQLSTTDWTPQMMEFLGKCLVDSENRFNCKQLKELAWVTESSPKDLKPLGVQKKSKGKMLRERRTTGGDVQRRRPSESLDQKKLTNRRKSSIDSNVQ